MIECRMYQLNVNLLLLIHVHEIKYVKPNFKHQTKHYEKYTMQNVHKLQN